MAEQKQSGPRVIWEIKECPICHHPETLAQLADKELKEAGRVPKEKFSSLGSEPIALTDPRLGLMVEVLVLDNDVCAKCGFPFFTRGIRTIGQAKMMKRK